MSRKQTSFPRKNKNSYTPIMLTSKSMRPVDRKQKGIKKLSYMYSKPRNGLDLLMAASLMNDQADSSQYQQLPSQLKNQIIKQINDTIEQIFKEQQFLQSHNNKQRYQENQGSFTSHCRSRKIYPATSVVKVQFSEESASNIKKGSFRQNQQRIQCQYIHSSTPTNLKKYIYYTNNQSRNKIQLPQNLKQLTVSTKHQKDTFGDSSSSHNFSRKKSRNQQWDKFLFKHYINIKKMKPHFKKQVALNIQQIAPEKAQIIEKRVDQILKNNQKKIQSIFTPHYKLKRLKNFSRQQQIIYKFKKEQKEDNLSKLKKIEQDVNTIAKKNNKKDFFVFGITQSSTKPMNFENSLKLKVDIYRDFIFKINFSNALYVKNREQIEKPYKLCIGNGNNSMLVKGIMKRRFWWQIVDKEDGEINFYWTQLKVDDFHNALQNGNPQNWQRYQYIRRNKFSQQINPNINSSVQFNENAENCQQFKRIFSQYQTPIANALNSSDVDENMAKSSESNSKIMKGLDLYLWQKHYEKHYKIEQRYHQSIYIKRFNSMIKKKHLDIIQDQASTKIHNHFECNYYIGNKKALFYYMRRFYKAKNVNPFNHIPLTFHIAQGVDDPQYEKFLQAYENFQKFKKQKRGQLQNFKNIWIVKPGEYTNRGRGITVCGCLDDIRVRLKGKQKNPVNNKCRTFIVQKYIQRPLLYHKRKFDIRHYMLMTCFNGIFKGYWYSDGYIRTTSTQYSTKNTKDIFIHLTNDAVQKNSSTYGKFQKGNKITYNQFQKYMHSKSKKKSKNEETPKLYENYNFFSQTLPTMRQLAIDSMHATYLSLSPNRKKQTFELFGLDFMLDQDLNVYLIQVNTNPCLQTTCPLLMKTISGLLENTFKICVDPFFPPPLEWPTSKKFLMGQNTLEQNKFELVFDEASEGNQIKKLLLNEQIENMGDVAQDLDVYEDEGNQWNEQV